MSVKADEKWSWDVDEAWGCADFTTGPVKDTSLAPSLAERRRVRQMGEQKFYSLQLNLGRYCPKLLFHARLYSSSHKTWQQAHHGLEPILGWTELVPLISDEGSNQSLSINLKSYAPALQNCDQDKSRKHFWPRKRPFWMVAGKRIESSKILKSIHMSNSEFMGFPNRYTIMRSEKNVENQT